MFQQVNYFSLKESSEIVSCIVPTVIELQKLVSTEKDIRIEIYVYQYINFFRKKLIKAYRR